MPEAFCFRTVASVSSASLPAKDGTSRYAATILALTSWARLVDSSQ